MCILNSSHVLAYPGIMFVLSTLRESVKLHPARLRHNFIDALTDALSQKYCNRVVPDLGLAIAVWDILEADDPQVHPGDAYGHVKVLFRLIVFRPLQGEVLSGRVRSANADGISITLGFFSDIHLPPGCMQAGTQYDQAEGVWVWSYEGNNLFMDVGEAIRFRVLDEHFLEQAPVQKETLMAAVRQAAAAGGDLQPAEMPEENILPAKPPYSLTVSIAEDGLGLLSWWGS